MLAVRKPVVIENAELTNPFIHEDSRHRARLGIAKNIRHERHCGSNVCHTRHVLRSQTPSHQSYRPSRTSGFAATLFGLLNNRRPNSSLRGYVEMSEDIMSQDAIRT
jgi:hypothetical protein